MPGKPPGELVLGILAAIKENGPMTRSEIAAHMQRGKNEVSSVVSRLNRELSCAPKRLRIVGYVYDAADSAIKYPRAQYDLGSGPDKPRPGCDRKAVTKRFRDSRKMRVASVFDLGKTVKQRISTNP